MVYGNGEGRVKVAATSRGRFQQVQQANLSEMKESRSLLSDVSRNSLSQDILLRAVLHQMPGLLLLDVVLVKYF